MQIRTEPGRRLGSPHSITAAWTIDGALTLLVRDGAVTEDWFLPGSGSGGVLKRRPACFHQPPLPGAGEAATGQSFRILPVD